MIAEEDVARLADAARTLPPAPAGELEHDLVTNLLVAVLDYQQRTPVVLRALAHFRARHGEAVRTLAALEALLATQPDDQEGDTALALDLWGYRLWTRAHQLRGLAAFFRAAGVTDQAALVAWARRSEFRRDFEGRVKGLGRAVYESLLMRLGVETVKPDVHVRRFAEAAVGRRLRDDDVVEVVTRAAAALGVRAYDLDVRIWEAGQGGPASRPRG